jgi:hypothetical protein
VGYWGALIRGGKTGWARRLREANFILAVATCGLALFLALPILNFGTISAGNQLHRLESGKVSPDKFDYAALRWDFGEAGQRALARLTKDSNPRVAELAQAAIDQKQRVYLGEGPGVRAARDFDLRVQPDDPDVRKLVLDYLTGNPYECRESCVALDLGAGANGGREVALIEGNGFRKLELPWREPQGSTGVKAAPPAVEVESGSQLKPGSTVEIRTVQKRYIFVDGKPMGQPLD